MIVGLKPAKSPEIKDIGARNIYACELNVKKLVFLILNTCHCRLNTHVYKLSVLDSENMCKLQFLTRKKPPKIKYNCVRALSMHLLLLEKKGTRLHTIFFSK